MKLILKIFLLLIVFNSFAQHNNIFHDRSFWKENPEVATIQQKISEGNDPIALNENGFDAVVYALLEKANDSAIKYLLALEGNAIDKKTHDGRIYLHWAAYSGKAEMVKTLLEMGSSITALDSHGATPLTFAVGSGLTDTAIYDIFIANGVNLAEEKNEDGANTLLLAAPYLDSEEDLEYFISKGLLLESTDNAGNGIFNYASKRGNIDFLKKLVRKGVNYSTLNKTGGNAFLFVAQGTRGFENKLEVYEYLKGLGLNPNIVTKNGYTPLHRLAYGNTDRAIIELFLNSGADVNQKDEKGNTPFLNAASRNTIEIVRLLSSNVKDFNLANNKGQTPLLLAVGSNSPDVVAFILENKVDALAVDVEGNSAAYYLATSFDPNKPEYFESKLRMLQRAGVNMNTVQANNNTLYHLAAKENNLALLKRLSNFGISPNAKNEEGLTALHLAAMKANDTELMQYLISVGADRNIMTDFEETAYDLARENEQLQKNNIALDFLK